MSDIASCLAAVALFVGGLATHHGVFTWVGAVLLFLRSIAAVKR